MARYNVPLESPTAIAADTGFLWLRPTATAGFKLRRITVASTTYATPPTVVAVDVIKIPFNSQAGADLPYEGDELYYAAIGTTDGFAFLNGGNALPDNHKMVLTAV